MSYFHPLPNGANKAIEVAVRTHNQAGRDQRALDYKAVMDTAQGRRVVWDILSMCGMWSEKDDTARGVGLKLMHHLWDTLADEYLMMHQEAVRDENAFAVHIKGLRDQEIKNADTRRAEGR